MKKQYERKFGDGLGDERQAKSFNRILTFQPDDNEDVPGYEADPRHAGIFASELGLDQAKPFSTPIV